VIFFTEFERFDRHCDKIKRQGIAIDYVVVCSPNYLHDAHIRFGLRIGADVICEKPVVLNPWNLEALLQLEKETGRKVYVVHQLRYHPEIIKLKERVRNSAPDKVWNIDLQYITPRGKWYQYSWKGDETKSGGVITNIGLHFFDILLWIFGGVKEMNLTKRTNQTASGSLRLDKAVVQWAMSIDKEFLSAINQEANLSSLRSLIIEGNKVDFSIGFEELHTQAYLSILNGQGIEIEATKEVVYLLQKMRS